MNVEGSTLEFENRIARLEGDIGALKVSLRSAKVTERMGRLPEITAEFVAKDRALDLGKVVGKQLRVVLTDEKKNDRIFSGVCVAAEYLGLSQGMGRYACEVRPWFWLLTQNRNSRIFQNRKTDDIVKDVLSEHGMWTNVRSKLSGTREARPYTVQYRESDFAFLSRLMEEEGIYYFFEGGAGVETMVLADGASAHQPVEGASKIKFNYRDGEFRRDDDHIFDWTSAERITPGRVTLDDYDFEKPKADQTEVNSFSKGPAGQKRLEIYDHHGRSRKGAFGAGHARVRMEAEAARQKVSRGAGNVRTMELGRTFKLDGHPRVKATDEFVLVAATHEIRVETDYDDDEIDRPLTQGGVDKGAEEETSDSYLCRFEVMPKSEPYRAPLQTPWPEVPGLLTAVVTGPGGEEIHTDKYGRIKVQFHWDREGKNDDKTTCWIRCVMPWAGKSWGMVSIPRIGQEVVIQFENGDPDRPICTGMLYNADVMPPYALPANKTQTGIVTRSTKSGSAQTFNELIFEDKKDAEFVRLQSEKDYKATIKNDAEITIGLEKQDPGDLTQTIHRNKTETLKTGDHDFKVEQGNQTVFVKANHKETIEGTATQTITGDTKQTITRGNLTRKVKMGSEDVTIDMGDFSLKTSLGEITLEALKKITLKVGQSTVVLDPMGVTIKGVNIKSEAQMKLDAKGLMTTIKGDVQATFQGTMTNVKGDAMLICKGAVTMIN